MRRWRLWFSALVAQLPVETYVSVRSSSIVCHLGVDEGNVLFHPDRPKGRRLRVKNCARAERGLDIGGSSRSPASRLIGVPAAVGPHRLAVFVAGVFSQHQLQQHDVQTVWLKTRQSETKMGKHPSETIDPTFSSASSFHFIQRTISIRSPTSMGVIVTCVKVSLYKGVLVKEARIELKKMIVVLNY